MKYTFKYRNFTAEVSTDKANWYLQFADQDGLINRWKIAQPATVEQINVDTGETDTYIIRVPYRYQLRRPSGEVLQQRDNYYQEYNYDYFYDIVPPAGMSYGNFAAIHAINGTLSRMPEFGGNNQATGYRCFNPDGSFYQPIVFDVINQTDETVAADGTGQTDGSFEIAVVNGAGGYEYSLDGATYQAGAVFSGLAVGDYTVYVRDAAGVVRYEPVIISQKYPATAIS